MCPHQKFIQSLFIGDLYSQENQSQAGVIAFSERQIRVNLEGVCYQELCCCYIFSSFVEVHRMALARLILVLHSLRNGRLEIQYYVSALRERKQG